MTRRKRENPVKPVTPHPLTPTQQKRGSCSAWLSGQCHGGTECVCIPSGGGR